MPGRFWEPPQSRALRTACEDRIGTAFLEVVDHSVVVIGPEGRRNELDLRQRDSGPAEQYCEPGIEHVGYTNDADGDPLTTEIVVIRDAIFHPKFEATRVQPRQHDQRQPGIDGPDGELGVRACEVGQAIGDPFS